MQNDLRKEQALEYHAKGRPGKIEVVPTKEAKTQRDLHLLILRVLQNPVWRYFATLKMYTSIQRRETW
jgi:malic enzyme